MERSIYLMNGAFVVPSGGDLITRGTERNLIQGLAYLTLRSYDANANRKMLDSNGTFTLEEIKAFGAEKASIRTFRDKANLVINEMPDLIELVDLRKDCLQRSQARRSPAPEMTGIRFVSPQVVDVLELHNILTQARIECSSDKLLERLEYGSREVERSLKITSEAQGKGAAYRHSSGHSGGEYQAALQATRELPLQLHQDLALCMYLLDDWGKVIPRLLQWYHAIGASDAAKNWYAEALTVFDYFFRPGTHYFNYVPIPGGNKAPPLHKDLLEEDARLAWVNKFLSRASEFKVLEMRKATFSVIERKTRLHCEGERVMEVRAALASGNSKEITAKATAASASPGCAIALSEQLLNPTCSTEDRAKAAATLANMPSAMKEYLQAIENRESTDPIGIALVKAVEHQNLSASMLNALPAVERKRITGAWAEVVNAMRVEPDHSRGVE